MSVIAYHAIFTTYGTWLPNDPRGSHSKQLYQEALADLGEIKPGRQYPQPSPETMRHFRVAAMDRLQDAPYCINNETRPVIADAFGNVVDRLGLVVHACAIMNNHVHIVIRRVTKQKIEYLVNQLKGAATHDLGLKKTPWTRGTGWKVFIDDEDVIELAVRYVEQNPIVAGMKRQQYNWVTPFYEWLEAEDCMHVADVVDDVLDGRRTDDR